MKTFRYLAPAMALAAVAMTACVADAPFAAEGEGYLKMNTDIRGDVKVTRSGYGDFDAAALAEKCVVYIESNRGLIHKYVGLDNVPSSIVLQSGNYVAEAWTGDSVSASYTSKFYRAYQKFEIKPGDNSLTLNCNIANVIVSVNPEALEVGLDNLKITAGHSRGELDFDAQAITDGTKGYFMLPNADKDVWYRIEGDKADGSHLMHEGRIENAERAHEYILNLKGGGAITDGAAWIRVEIEDVPVIDVAVEILGRPALELQDHDFENQIVATPGTFSDLVVYAKAFKGISSFKLHNEQGFDNHALLSEDIDIINCSDQRKNELHAAGISWESIMSNDAASGIAVEELYVRFNKEFLDNLEVSDSEYILGMTVSDTQDNMGLPKWASASLRIANTEDAIVVDDPVMAAPAPDKASQPMAITGSQATLTGYIVDTAATGYGIKYREKGTAQWIYQPAEAAVRTRAELIPFTVTITGLRPGVTYDYAAYSSEFDEGEILTFATETPFAMPNASFEKWDTYSAKTMLGTKNVVFPGTGERTFWDSGNEGAATANKVLTNKSTDMVHSGTYSARLGSSSALGVLAAGNIFVGSYVKTDGTNGVLSLGREYNGSHPTALRVFANYRPGIVDIIKSGNEEYLDFAKGDSDHGQIYVALTTAPIEIRTNPDNRKLFDRNDSEVLAYGQVTMKEAFGPDGALAEVRIPLEYKEEAQTQTPTHLVIVVSASKFGDYFSGSSSSVYYLDDFELLYE